ncbi:MAG: fumarate hydratase C-terminal domain-containing protein [Sphingomonas sp.]
MAEHHLTLPTSQDRVRELRAGDTVYLDGEITVTGGLPAHKRMMECLTTGTPLPLTMSNAFIHLPHMIEERADGGYDVQYVNPTTSTRFDEFMPAFIRGFDLRVVGGKGGLGAEAVAAMRDVGCVYLSLLGGGSAILSAAIREVLQVEWRDFPSHFRLSRMRVADFGPLTVGIDAHGNSIYERLAQGALERRSAILERLDERRAAATPAPATHPIIGQNP